VIVRKGSVIPSCSGLNIHLQLYSFPLARAYGCEHPGLAHDVPPFIHRKLLAVVEGMMVHVGPPFQHAVRRQQVLTRVGNALTHGLHEPGTLHARGDY
jgi:hypothetical protein